MTIVMTGRRILPSFGSLAFLLVGVVLTSILDKCMLPSRFVGDDAQETIIRKEASYQYYSRGGVKCATSSVDGDSILNTNTNTDTNKTIGAPQQIGNGDEGLYSSIILENQVRRQALFQALIHRNQHPTDCRTRRILLTHDARAKDGFTLEAQLYARHLQAGMAMDRTFVFGDRILTAYAPANCQWSTMNMTNVTNSWNCLYEAPSNCTETMVNAKIRNEQGNEIPPPDKVNASSKFMMTYGIHVVNSERGSGFFNSAYYGNSRIVDGIPFDKPFTRNWNVDVLEHWDRVMGRFWIRAQMAHYLWRPSVGLKSEMDLRMPQGLISSSASSSSLNSDDKNKRFIGMHIRFTDNVKHFLNDFGRDANVTRSLDHFMEVAQEIRNETGISTIYLATDSTEVMKRLEESTYSQEGWSFHIQNGVMRSDSHQVMWFKKSRASMAAAIATDVEVLRRADYLIGSYQSNVFRLATELNTVYQVAKYPLDVNRHRTVDIEWYEDP